MKTSGCLAAIFLILFVVFFLGCPSSHHSGGGAAAADDDGSPGDDDSGDDDNDDDTAPPGPLSLSAMTFNVMFDFPDPGFDPWKIRGPHEGDIINYHHCDLVGLQEPFQWQVDDLHGYCPGYDDWHIWDTDATMFFAADRFEAIDKGQFWLSPTPDRVSIGFGNFMPRLVAWAKLLDSVSGRTFFFADTHFDNTSPFQKNAAPLFLGMIEALAAGLPVVVTGDFNSRPDSEAYQILTNGAEPGGFKLTNAFDLAGNYDVRNAPGDERPYDPVDRIDHIFVANGEWMCSHWVVDMTRYGDPLRDPSDHFAIAADVELPGQ